MPIKSVFTLLKKIAVFFYVEGNNPCRGCLNTVETMLDLKIELATVQHIAD